MVIRYIVNDGWKALLDFATKHKIGYRLWLDEEDLDLLMTDKHSDISPCRSHFEIDLGFSMKEEPLMDEFKLIVKKYCEIDADPFYIDNLSS